MSDVIPSSDHHPSSYKRKFNPGDYLKLLYSELSPTFVYYMRGLVSILRDNACRIPKDGKALDFGGGASMWPSFALSHYIDSIQFCDYVPANLQAVQSWLNHSKEAHDWTTFFHFILEENQTSKSELSKWEDQLRKALNSPLLSCDIHDPNCPILSNLANQYDVIVTCECLECACQTRDEYKQAVQRLVRILKPGGLLIIFGVTGCSFYIIEDERFSCLPVDENLVCEAMQEADIKQFNIQSKKFGDGNNPLVDYDGCLIVTAIKSDS